MDQTVFAVFQLAVLLISVMLHELAHGLMALRLGDTTARDAGRLSLNPLRHLDPVGSLLLPLALFFIGSPVLFGWAKPVPYNPSRLKNPRMGAALIGAAGPLSNLCAAIIVGFIARALAGSGAADILLLFLNSIVVINILLAVLNLMPIPPLDGSRLLFALVSPKNQTLEALLTRYGLLLMLFFLFFIFPLLTPLIGWLSHLILGPAALR